MGSHALVLLVGFATAIVVARAGADDLGRYRLGQAMLMYVVVGADAGMTLYAVREIARRPADAMRYAGPVLVARFGLALILFVAAVAAILSMRTGDAAGFYVVILLGVFPLSLSLIHVFQGLERLRVMALVRVVSVAVGGAVGLAAYVMTDNLVALVIPALVIGLGVDAVLILIVRRSLDSPLMAGSWSLWSALLVGGFPFLVTAVAVQLVSNADAIIIGTMRGEAQLGLYAAAYVLAGQLLFLAGPIAWALYPRLSALHELPDRFRQATRQTFSALGLAIIPTCVGVALLSMAIVELLYGPEYAASALVLAVLMGMPLVGFYNVGMSQVLNAAGRQSSVARIAVTAAIVNVGLNLLLIPSVGLLGAAFAAVITEIVTAAAYTRAGWPIVRATPARAYVQPLWATAAMAAAVGVVRLSGVQPYVPLAVVSGLAAFAVVIAVRPPEAARMAWNRLTG